MSDDTADIVSKALRRAWQLGQTYWQQADSESYSANKRAATTEATFSKLVDDTRAALAAAQPPAAMPAPTGWICRHKQQVADAEEAFPGQPHDYLWKYTHGTRDMAECEGYGDFDVVRLYATPQAQSVPATGAQPWQKPGPVTDVHPLECLIVIQSLRQSDGDWWARGDHFFSADSPLAWMPDTPENSALLTGASPTAPTGSAG